jgi:hypothetical protein
MFIQLQILSALFAFLLAFLNEVPVRKMVDFGASRKEEKRFHRANFLVKLAFAAIVSYLWGGFDYTAIIALFTFGIIQWMVFDCALGHFIHQDWFYIGSTAWIDKKLNGMFMHGEAGEVKAGLCFVAIVIINVLFH